MEIKRFANLIACFKFVYPPNGPTMYLVRLLGQNIEAMPRFIKKKKKKKTATEALTFNFDNAIAEVLTSSLGLTLPQNTTEWCVNSMRYVLRPAFPASSNLDNSRHTPAESAVPLLTVKIKRHTKGLADLVHSTIPGQI